MPSLITIFGDIPDPRRGDAQRHDLLDILTIALVASVCGAESCVDLAGFAGDREPLLRGFLRQWVAKPRHVQPGVPVARSCRLRAGLRGVPR